MASGSVWPRVLPDFLSAADGVDWDALPADALATIVNCCALRPRDIAALRTTCRAWRSATDAVLERLAPGASTSHAHFTSLPRRFPMLRHLDLSACDHRLFNHRLLYTHCQSTLSLFITHLAAMPSLSHLTLSCEFASEMGRKLWARHTCAAALGGLTVADSNSSSSSSSSSSSTPDVQHAANGGMPEDGDREPSGDTASHVGANASDHDAAGEQATHGMAGAGAPAHVGVEGQVSRQGVPSCHASGLSRSSGEEEEEEEQVLVESDECGSEASSDAGVVQEGEQGLGTGEGRPPAPPTPEPGSLVPGAAATSCPPPTSMPATSTDEAQHPAAGAVFAAAAGPSAAGSLLEAVRVAPATWTEHAKGPQPAAPATPRTADAGSCSSARACPEAANSNTPAVSSSPSPTAPPPPAAASTGPPTTAPTSTPSHPAAQAIAGAATTVGHVPRSVSSPGRVRYAGARCRQRQRCASVRSAGAQPWSQLEDEQEGGGWAPSLVGATHQAQMWLPDWGLHLPALTTVTIAPAGGVGAPRASCPPRALDPATNQAAVMRLWLRPRALRRITSLSLAGVAIGALGPELMCLTSLSHLDLSGCALTHLPVGLSPWGGCVAALHLRDNALRTLPQEVSSLTSLTHLDLSHNMLSSLPPTCLPLSLRTLLLDNNQLADVPEAVTHLASRPGLFSRDGAAAAGHVVTAPGTSLTGANAGGSSSSGAGSSSCSPARTHPTASAECAGSQHVSGSGRAGSGLQALTLSHNYLMGVPGFGWQLAGLTALTRLELTNVSDAYSGPLTITPEVSQLRQLQVLVAGDNAGGLSLAPEISELAPSLTSLDVQEVAFTELPPALSRLTRLRTLAAGGNPLPALPPWLPALSACLTHLDVSRSRELRVLPDTTSHLTSLTSLDVSHCGLSELPGKVLGSLPRLTRLDASGNALKHVPPALCAAPRLCTLSLRGCGLSEGAVRHAVSLLGRVAGPPVELHL